MLDAMPDARPPRHRYAVLDTYRFIAALGVVLYHFEGNLSPLHGAQTDALDRFQSLVDFFFALSGFVLMHTYGAEIRDGAAYRSFLRKRLARIYPLQIATVLLCVGIAVLVAVRHVPMHDRAMIDMGLVPQNLMLIQSWGTTPAPGLDFPSWSISAEFFVYLLYPAFAVLVVRARPERAIALALACAGTIELVRWHLGLRPGYLATFDAGMLRAVPSFLAGMAVCRWLEGRPVRPISWAWVHGLVLIIAALMLAKAPLPTIVVLFPLLVGLIAAADRGGRPTGLAHPVLIELGNASFAIYLLHTFVAVACVAVARHLGLSSVPALAGVAAIGIGATIGLGVASYRWFETPLRRMLSGSGPIRRRQPTTTKLTPSPQSG